MQKAVTLSDNRLLVGEGGFEPPKSLTTDLQSAPFGHSGILPYSIFQLNGAGGRIRTPDLLITNQLLYLLSYTSLSCFLSRFWPLASALIYNNRWPWICQQVFSKIFYFLNIFFQAQFIAFLFVITVKICLLNCTENSMF